MKVRRIWIWLFVAGMSFCHSLFTQGALRCRMQSINIQSFPQLSNVNSMKMQAMLDGDKEIEGYGELFREWEVEETELASQETNNAIAEMKDEFGYSALPAYVLKWLRENKQESPSSSMPAAKLPTLAIIGRPNTGKSTLVNRISKSFKDGAIVHDQPGITRDRTYRLAEYGEYNFQIVDTGGIIFDDTNDIFADQITEQALIALREASVAVMVCDGKEGVTQLDEILANWLRKHNKIPIYVAVNKCESDTQGLLQAHEFWKLGLGQPIPVSGIHGVGVFDLLDAAVQHMPKVANVLPENATNVALVGRPNVGKSSLLNRLSGQMRSIVSDVAGTTRDTIDAVVHKGQNRTYRIIDTAGIRKRNKVEYGTEFFMVNRAFKAIRRADCVVLLLDAVSGIVDQDRILAERIAQEGRACVIALNKWDAIPNKNDKSYLKAIENIRETLPMLKWAEIVLISALEGQRTEKLFDCIDRANQQFTRRVSTATLNEVVTDATLWMAPPIVGSRSGRIYYCLQIGTAPPTIVFFVNNPDLFTESYRRYLERKIREGLNFEGTPLKMIWRGKSLRSVNRAAKKGEIGEDASKAVSHRK